MTHPIDRSAYPSAASGFRVVGEEVTFTGTGPTATINASAVTPDGTPSTVATGTINPTTAATVLPALASAAEWVHWSALVPWAGNPRKNARAVPKVAASIRRFGFVAPVVVWREANRMVAGHTRVQAMRGLCEANPSYTAPGAPGPGLVRVVFHPFPSEADADAYAIADNRLGELASWDQPKLDEIAARLPPEDRAIVGLGDAAPTLPEENTRPPSPSKLGSWRIIRGTVEDVSRELPAHHFHALLSDPPYGLSYAGKRWDITVPPVATWQAIRRTLLPGAHLAAFSADRTYHHLAMAIESAGHNVRAMLSWIYGEGYPKSVNLPLALEEHGLQGDELELAAAIWEEHRTAIKPACEPCCLARVPLDGTLAANLLAHGTGALWLEGTRLDRGSWPTTVLLDDAAASMLDEAVGERPSNPFPSHDGGASVHPAVGGARSAGGQRERGLGPSRFFYVAKPSRAERDRGCDALPLVDPTAATGRAEGSAGLNSPRAGAGRLSGVRNHHPTLKPVSLMRHLAALMLPPPLPDGTPRRILVPYSGSGSEIIGCLLAGWDEVVGIEVDPAYVAIAKERITHACAHPEEWAVEGTWNPDLDDTENLDSFDEDDGGPFPHEA